MSWERPDDRHGRTAVFLLVAAVLIATALAVALVAGAAASQSSSPSDDVVVRDAPVTNDTPSVARGARPASPAEVPTAGPAPGGYGNLVIA